MATRPEAATASAHDVRCSAAHPSSRSQDRTVRQRPRQRAAGAGPCATRLEVHNTTASSEASSASPHRYRLHCCDIAATAGARHITVAGRRPEGFRCGGFGGHLTAPRTSATPVSHSSQGKGAHLLEHRIFARSAYTFTEGSGRRAIPKVKVYLLFRGRAIPLP